MSTTIDLLGTSFRTLLPISNSGRFSLRETWLTLRNMAITINDPSKSDIPHGINRLIANSGKRLREDLDGEVLPIDVDCQALYRENYDPEIDLDSLAQMPPDSLGYQYHRFIKENEIYPLDTLARIEGDDAIAYRYRRAYKLHDILHVVMGWDASVLGEVRIVSFSIGQSGDNHTRQMPLMALAVLYLNLLIKRPWQLREAIRLNRKYQSLGESAPLNLLFKFEEHWEKTPEEVRELYLAS